MKVYSCTSKVINVPGIYPAIVNGDMVWKLGKFQSVYNELRYYVESASPFTNLLKFCLLISVFPIKGKIDRDFYAPVLKNIPIAFLH